jgi:hypothetical protein
MINIINIKGLYLLKIINIFKLTFKILIKLLFNNIIV